MNNEQHQARKDKALLQEIDNLASQAGKSPVDNN